MISVRYFFLITFISLSYNSTSHALWWSYASSRGTDNHLTTHMEPKVTNQFYQESACRISQDKPIHCISLFQPNTVKPTHQEAILQNIIKNHQTFYQKNPIYQYISLFIELGQNKQCCIAGSGKWSVLIGTDNSTFTAYELNQSEKNLRNQGSQEGEPLNTSSEPEAPQEIETKENHIIELDPHKVSKISFILLATSEFWRCQKENNLSNERIANFIHRCRESQRQEALSTCAQRLIEEVTWNRVYHDSTIHLQHTSVSVAVIFPHN